MAGLYLVDPGKRKGNKDYLIRGAVVRGAAQVEISTGTTDHAAAMARMAAVERELLEQLQPKTFGRTLDVYVVDRRPAKVDRQRLEKVQKTLGFSGRPIRQIASDPDSIYQLAEELCPGCSAATKNRNVLTPILAVLHYAADKGMCPYLRMPRFREARDEVDEETGRRPRSAGRPDAFHAKYGAQTAGVARLVAAIVDSAARTAPVRNWLKDQPTRSVIVQAIGDAIHALGDGLMRSDQPQAPGPTKKELHVLEMVLFGITKAVADAASDSTAEPTGQVLRELRDYWLKVGAVPTTAAIRPAKRAA
jgi:hypothetical protein